MSVSYRITPAEPRAHYFQVRLRVADPGPAPVRFRMPGWIRGSYLVRDFAKHVVEVSAQDEAGRALRWRRLDKRSLEVDPGDGALLLDYRVYAFDPSVRKAFLDTRRGFFNPGSLCYAVDGRQAQPIDLELQAPDDPACADWRVATSLPAVAVDARGFGRYRAAHYEDLLDQPVELGAFERIDFDVNGMPHALVFAGHAAVDTGRVVDDLRQICAAEHAFFGDDLRLDRYLFLTAVTTQGYGGLEHRHSTALVCARGDLPAPGERGMSAGYRAFLGLAAHEYFHLWNVKRITAERFAESDLGSEAYSRDLWHYEGVTSYYDDLFLLRAGRIPAEDYLDLLAQQATRLWRSPGRLRQTLEDASFETWIKYYQPDENSANQNVNYYVKGALVALGLDLQLRLHSSSLDAVMRRAWQDHGRHDRPLPEGGLERLASEAANADLSGFFDRVLRSTEELPLAAWLAAFGVEAESHSARGAGDGGGRNAGTPPPSSSGLKLAPNSLRIAQVLAGSPAERADLAVHDELVALDGWQLQPGAALETLSRCTPGQPVCLHRFRDGQLGTVSLVPEAPPAEVLARRHAWLGV
jgi:predicted metalloprotease with PDZ domain